MVFVAILVDSDKDWDFPFASPPETLKSIETISAVAESCVHVGGPHFSHRQAP